MTDQVAFVSGKHEPELDTVHGYPVGFMLNMVVMEHTGNAVSRAVASTVTRNPLAGLRATEETVQAYVANGCYIQPIGKPEAVSDLIQVTTSRGYTALQSTLCAGCQFSDHCFAYKLFQAKGDPFPIYSGK